MNRPYNTDRRPRWVQKIRPGYSRDGDTLFCHKRCCLPPEFREIFILHYYQGYGISEIAQITGVAEGTISSRLSRGRKKLKSVLGEGGEEA